MRIRLFPIILAILIVVMMFAAVGCENNRQDKLADDKPTSTEDLSDENADSEGQEEQSVEVDPFGKYDPSIEVTFVRSTDDSIETNVLSKLDGETIDDNRWTRLYEEELGIKIKYLWIAKGADQYEQKFNIAMASGDIPDVVTVNSTQLKQLAESDILQDVSGVLKYASPLSQKIMDDAGKAPFNAVTFDGKIMGIPVVNSNLEQGDFIWLRTDWMKKYGLSQPQTMDDLFNIMDIFVKNDPDGNGENDTIGLVLTKKLWEGFAGLEGFFNGYHAYPNAWIEKDGKLVYGSIQPEMKEPLIKLAEMYQKGYLDREFAVKDSGKVAETTTSGKSGIVFGQHWVAVWPLQSNIDNDPNADWKAFPLVSADNQPVYTQIKMGTTTWIAINKNMKHPEAVMKMFNLFAEKIYDPEKQEYIVYGNTAETEGLWKLSPILTFLPMKNLDIWNNLKKALENGSGEELWGETKAMYDNCRKYMEGDNAFWGWNRVFGIEGSWAVVNDYYNNNKFIMDQFVGAPTATMVEKKGILDKMHDEIITRIIMGEVSIDDYDKFIDDWKKLGGDAMTQEVNDWYQSIR